MSTMNIIVVMGVCGSGKTTVAELLSKKIRCTYCDADDFHSEENKNKMASGNPLTDEDRIPWLLAMHAYIKSLIDSNTAGVLTCSALKRKYRNILVYGEEALAQECIGTQRSVLFVYLKGSPALISVRMNSRKGHFMPPALLKSQFDILEEPGESEWHLTVDVDKSIEGVLDTIIKHLNL